MEYFQIDLPDSGTCDHPTRWSSHPQLSVPGPKLQKVWADMEQKCWETMLELHLGSLVYVRICCSLVSRKKSWEFLLTIASAVSVVWGVQTIRSRRFFMLRAFFVWVGRLVIGRIQWFLDLTQAELNWWLDHWLLLVIYWPTQFISIQWWLYMVIIGDWIGQVVQPVPWGIWTKPMMISRESGTQWGPVKLGRNMSTLAQFKAQIGWRVFGFLQVFRVHVIVKPKLWFSKWRHVKNPEV